MKDFWSRCAVTLVAIGVLIALLVFAFHPWVQYGVVLFVACLAAVAIWEYDRMSQVKNGKVLFPLSVAIVFSFFLQAGWPLLVFFLAVATLFAFHFRRLEGAILDLAVSSFGLLYIAVPLGMMLGILFMPKGDGRIWIVYLLAVTKATDMGGYFFGSLWGKRKLAPTISPSKTVEGAIFGWIAAIVVSGLFSLSGSIGLYPSLLLGAILGVASQFGDLSESLLKRDANIKDSNQIPGVGGVLDMVDSLLCTAPILYLYLSAYDHCY
ncbi:MAG: phosphatidate cytidylyltransferase [Chlamydiia bacterium]|nr:phosphatidate cytidylyltransferase [Chlamydiia bacterium]